MSDLISRQDAIDALKRSEARTRAFGFHNVIDTIRDLPSAQPERKTGRWIDESVVTGTTSGATTIIRQYRCSECGGLFGRQTDNYCYNCGVKMETEQ